MNNRAKYLLILFFLSLFAGYDLLAVAASSHRKKERLSEYVNPFIGASTNVRKARAGHGLGKTFPGATTPWGMTQVSPNTITGGDNGPGYSDEHTTIEGFALTQMSGIGWYGDLGNFLVMPTTGELFTYRGSEQYPEKGYRSRYDKRSEKASAGYYSVFLSDYKIKAELTATPHCGIMRFTYPKHKQARIQIDLARRVGGTSTRQYIERVDDRTIRGWMRCTPAGGGWGNGSGKADYTVYFYAQFSCPLKEYGIWSADIPDNWTRRLGDIGKPEYIDRVIHAETFHKRDKMEGNHLGFYTEFPTEEDDEVVVKTGISFVSMKGAEMNLKAEVRGWNFDRYRDKAASLWDEALSKIKVSGGTRDMRTIFYTALYHTMIDPRAFTDVTGEYIGGDKQVHKTDDFIKRTVFSGWDVFRSQFPLQTIINPEVVNDMICSFISLAEENGTKYYDRWEFLNAYSGCMVGNPAISVIADAYRKGIRNYDVKKAYAYAVNTAEKMGNDKKLGYVPGRVSETLEYAYSDWCLSVLAEDLGCKEAAAEYFERSRSYSKVFDEEQGWFRPRNADGTWKEWPEEGRLKESYGCVESNLYQQGWFVPHDIPGMADLMGGRTKTLADLTNFFEKCPSDFLWNAYYNHANEPVHHVPFLFNRLGAPWLTQYWTRAICNGAYKNKVEGLVGNEDVGQMSAWYVLSAMGFHPVCPGETRYELTTPLFDRVEIKLDDRYAKGKKFIIKTVGNASEACYIQSAKLNGKSLEKCYIDHSDIMNGGEISFRLASYPNYLWGLE